MKTEKTILFKTKLAVNLTLSVKFLRSQLEFIDAHQQRNQVYFVKYTPVITTEFE